MQATRETAHEAAASKGVADEEVLCRGVREKHHIVDGHPTKDVFMRNNLKGNNRGWSVYRVACAASEGALKEWPYRVYAIAGKIRALLSELDEQTVFDVTIGPNDEETGHADIVHTRGGKPLGADRDNLLKLFHESQTTLTG